MNTKINKFGYVGEGNNRQSPVRMSFLLLAEENLNRSTGEVPF